MTKVFIGETLTDFPLTDLIRPNLGVKASGRWAERYASLQAPIVEIVKNVEESDYLLLPHNYNFLKNHKLYLNTYEELAEKLQKKILIFFPGDSDEDVPIKNSLVFRNSKYRSELKENEIILPGYVEDLGQGIVLEPRAKKDRAMVGFCGWAILKDPKQRFKFAVRSLGVSVAAIFNERRLLRQKGIWWRKKALTVFRSSRKVNSNFIVRGTYSGNEKTMEVAPEQARNEYIGNILNSDFTLCVKGDGNFSTRFFEVLSLGRIPLLLDTDSVLPLEDQIDYGQCVLKISWHDLKNLDVIAANYYRNLSNEDFERMQKRAREVFEKFLKLDRFLTNCFNGDFLINFQKSART